jgi:hypothetical protein
VREALESVLYGKPRPHRVPDLWDGRTAERVVMRMEEFLSVTGIERESKSEIRSPKS